MNSLRPLAFLCLVLLILAGCSEPTPQDPVKRLEGGIFGTFWVVSISETLDEEALASLNEGINETLDRVDRQMSTWKQESELMQLNRHPVEEWFDVSPELMQVLQVSQQVAEQSQGAFDVTVGNLVNLWSFGPEQQPQHIPDSGALETQLDIAGYAGLELDPDTHQVRRMNDFFIDLSGVAKGFAVDEVGRYLQAQNLNNFLVNIGGELLAVGEREPESPWRIGIELPHSGVQVAHHIIPVEDMSVATSGDYRNYFEIDGKRYSHTLDPTTGWPIEHRVASVTILTPNNVDADAWATAMMVLGIDGLALAEEQGLRVLMLEKVDDNWVTHLTSSMKDYLGDEIVQELE